MLKTVLIASAVAVGAVVVYHHFYPNKNTVASSPSKIASGNG